MKIDSSSVQLSSQHAAVEWQTRQESLRMWVGSQRPDFEGAEAARELPTLASHPDVATISTAARAARDRLAAAADSATAATAAQVDEAGLDPKTWLLKLLVEYLTGRKIKLLKLEDVQPPAPDGSTPANGEPPAVSAGAGYGVEYDLAESRYEAERTTFAAEGVVRTADGQEVRFKVALEMSREFASERRVSLRLGDAARQKDPLVINFGGTAAQLTDVKFSFDLDADGAADQVSFVGPGSGFLALDADGNGRIDDGAELFGPRTGDGLAELAVHDLDGNGWIDASDPVYARLRVWSKAGSGADALATLAQRSVGAIYLGSAATPFALKDGQNASLGQVRSTGVYLRTDGSAGTVQQVDLAV